MGLFSPAWQGKNEEKALRAVSKIGDKSKLKEIVGRAPLETVRYAAIKKIFSLSNSYIEVETLFNNAINAQAVLQYVALNDQDRMFRQYAVRKLADESVVALIARNDENEYVRSTAVEKLTEQNVLSDIARSDPQWNVRREATKRLSNQSLLSLVATSDRHELVRKEAVERLDDQSTLADISLHDANWEVRRSAIERVTDQAAIGTYLVTEKGRAESYRWFNSCDSEGLLNRIDDPGVLAYVAKKSPDNAESDIGAKALKRISDEATLVDIAKCGDASEYVRIEAIQRIGDERALIELATETANCQRVRLFAVEKLTDISVLRDLSQGDANEEVCLQALNRLRHVCPHEWSYDAHCRRRCAICGIYEYHHDYVVVDSQDHGNGAGSIIYVCKRCGHEAGYSQSETHVSDTRETGFIPE